MPPVDDPSEARRREIVARLQGREIEQAIADPDLRRLMEEEAASPDPDKLVTPDLLEVLDRARARQAAEHRLGFLSSIHDVLIVPGFMGSELTDVTGPNGLIWVDPGIVFNNRQLLDLRLGPSRPGRPDRDAAPGVTIRANGAVPLIYGGLKYDLKVRGYDARIVGFDWRKDIDESAEILAGLIRDRGARGSRPLHLVAHSQGSLVARRALQRLGPDLARRLVSNLVLLGPATSGTFSAAFALAGSHETIEAVRRFGVHAPAGFTEVLQSMTGLYQLLPWRDAPVDGRARPEEDAPFDWLRRNRAFGTPAFWASGVDAERLERFYGWGARVDSSFFNDRTTIVLGDHETTGGAGFVAGALVKDDAFRTRGDGTVPDAWARVPGVTRIFRARGAEHMMLPATLSVIGAVRDVLAGRTPRVDRVLGAAPGEVPVLAEPAEDLPASSFRRPPSPARTRADDARRAEAGDAGDADDTGRDAATGGEAPPPVRPPEDRALRVFSFDPLLATDLDALGIEQITLRLPWAFADGDRLAPGPVGEYLEVVDYDPANRCFYPPVDLDDPHLLAQAGLAPTEGDPRFHQQMTYAVAMNTIRHFEQALGRAALWSPHLERDEQGEVIPGQAPEREFVRRLRVYPHALRQANAFYHPDKKALLFGYFPAQGAEVGRNLPGGMVFTCLSYDIIAHETTHALLDGLHRYFLEPSNPDVYAFHEAFADVVALFQHFSHPEVLRHQVVRTGGDLRRENLLGVLAAQFGEAIGGRGGLRRYLGERDDRGNWAPIKPDPSAIARESEPHARGAILVAALFRAFLNIYDSRVGDLRRIAGVGRGLGPDGEIHPDLAARLAGEAATAARHMLAMCIRALDYIPPVDVTFGEYLRALITADYDLIRDDDRRYRVSVVSAFRDWGIYPGDVRSLSVDGLLWSPPEPEAIRHVRSVFDRARRDLWTVGGDRLAAYQQMRELNLRVRRWLRREVPAKLERYFGLALGDDAPRSIRRKRGGPVFEVHSTRPCRRIGPDGQERTDFVVEVVQRRKAFFDEARQRALEEGRIAYDGARPDFYFRGGGSLIIDAGTGEIRYVIRKAICRSTAEPWQDDRLIRERRFRQGQFGDGAVGAYLDDPRRRNPFAFLHRES